MNEAMHGNNETLFSPQPQPRITLASGETAPVTVNGEAVAVVAEAPAEVEQDVVTACYLCHGQCVNFGLDGVAGRPCARGVSAIVNRRRTARLKARAARREDV